MNTTDLRAFAQRDWGAVARAEQGAWRVRRAALGSAEGFRLAAEVSQALRALRPDWPSPDERAADLEMHLWLAQALRSVASA